MYRNAAREDPSRSYRLHLQQILVKLDIRNNYTDAFISLNYRLQRHSLSLNPNVYN